MLESTFRSPKDGVFSWIGVIFCVLFFGALFSPFLWLDSANAQSSAFTYEGRLYSSSGVPVLDSVDVKFQILNPAGNCVLYEEVQSAVNLSSSKGAFSLSVGSALSDAKRSANFRGAYNPSMISVFRNGATLSGIPVADCAAGSYVAGSSDTRLLRVHVTKSGATETLSPDLVINTVPSAQVAASLQGFLPSDFLRLDIANGISGNIGLTAVGSGAGQTREFRFYELAANGVEYSAFKAPDAMASSLTYVLPSSAPAAGDVLKATVPSSGMVTLSWGADAGAGGGISNFNGSNQSSQSFTAVDIAAVVTAPAWTTNIGTGAHTLQIPMAVGAGVTGGLITKAEHTAFTAKVNRSGDTMSGNLAMGTNRITGVGDPTAAQEAATKAYVDAQDSGKISGTLTATRIPFASGASTLTDSASFTYNPTTGAMGIGGTAPSIISNDGLTIAAGGTNQNVVLTPSGTGFTLLGGNVGIGTTSPGTLLDLNGGAGRMRFDIGSTFQNADIQFGTSGNPNRWRLGYVNSSAVPPQGLRIQNDTGGLESTWSYPSGNFGVGTSYPATPVDISGTDTDGTLRVFDQTATTGVTRAIVRAGAGQSTTNLMEWQNSAGTALSRVDSSGRFVGDGSQLTGISGAISGMTVGRVPFSTAATTLGDDAAFLWDNTNKRLGISNTPTYTFQVGDHAGRFFAFDNASDRVIARSTDNIAAIPITLQNLDTTASSGITIPFQLSENGTNIRDAAAIRTVKEQAWTGTVGTMDAALTFSTTLDSALGEKMRITSAGNVGIGTASPGDKLQVSGGIVAAGGLTGTNISSGLYLYDNGTAHLESYTNGSSSRDLSISGRNINFKSSTSYTTKMILDENGNVGIGTTAPVAPLHVVGAAPGNGPTALFYNTASGGTGFSLASYYPGIGFNTFWDGSNRTMGAGYGGNLYQDPTNGDILLTSSPSAATAANQTFTLSTRLIVKQSGNVGIGTTSPGALLQLGTAGTSLGTMRLTGNTSGFVQVQPAAAAGSWNLTLPPDDGNSGDVLRTDGSGVTTWVAPSSGISGLTAGRVPFATSATTLGNDANLFWDNTNKRLGIGSSSPTYSLHVTPTSGATAGQTALIQDATATTGATTLIVRAGAGQSGSNLTVWQNSSGTALASISQNGDFVGTNSVVAPTVLSTNNYSALNSLGVAIGGTGSILGFTNASQYYATVDTALSRIAAGTLAVGTGAHGNSAGTLIAGAIGIGTTSPGQILTAATSGDTKVQSRSSGATGLAEFYAENNLGNTMSIGRFGSTHSAYGAVGIGDAYLYSSTGGLGIGADSVTGIIKFGTGAGVPERMRIDATGNVGIGTLNPTSKLQIDDGSVLVFGTGTTDRGYAVGHTSATNSLWGMLVSNASGALYLLDGEAATTPFVVENGAATNSLYIKTNGNVGVGTMNPLDHLHVSGTGVQTIRVQSTNGNNVGLRTITDSGDWSTYVDGTLGSFRIRDVFSSADRLTIDSFGNVGIGTTNPQQKLQLAGALRLEPQASPPGTASNGDIYYDTSHAVCAYVNGSWSVIAGPGSCL